MLRQLEQHYGQPVMPVESYCAALKIWAAIIVENNRTSLLKYGHGSTYFHVLNDVIRDITKSNLLGRLIYGKQKLRTRKCPTHEGRWSGCTPNPCPDGCSDGINVTGWLPEVDLAPAK